jgi:hypothetical protein
MAFSRHLWAHSGTYSFFPFSIVKRLDLYRAISMLNLYFFTNAPTNPLTLDLGIIKLYIPSQYNITKAILKKIDEQFLIMDNLYHFIIVCL